jgi:hypothetical protein
VGVGGTRVAVGVSVGGCGVAVKVGTVGLDVGRGVGLGAVVAVDVGRDVVVTVGVRLGVAVAVAVRWAILVADVGIADRVGDSVDRSVAVGVATDLPDGRAVCVVAIGDADTIPCISVDTLVGEMLGVVWDSGGGFAPGHRPRVRTVKAPTTKMPSIPPAIHIHRR